MKNFKSFINENKSNKINWKSFWDFYGAERNDVERISRELKKLILNKEIKFVKNGIVRKPLASHNNVFNIKGVSDDGESVFISDHHYGWRVYNRDTIDEIIIKPEKRVYSSEDPYGEEEWFEW